MLNGKIKTALYVLIAISSIFLLKDKYLSYSPGSPGLSDSLLVSTLGESSANEPVDLGITSVKFKKIAEPNKNFYYYKYQATIVIKNFGGNLKNGQVVLSGDGQRNVFVTNTPNGLTLAKGQSYTVRNYEILFDANYNGGTVNLKLDLKSAEDYYKANNDYKAEFAELPSKIDSIGLESIDAEGNVKIKYEPRGFALSADKFEIYENNSLDVSKDQEKYAEIADEDRVYSYYRIRNAGNLISAKGWEAREISYSDDHYAAMQIESNDVKYVYIRATNPETGLFAVSNILKFVPQKNLNRAEFARYFVSFTKAKIFEDGKMYFDDVKLDADYASSVQTLYNLGLIKREGTKYYPEKQLARAEGLRFVLDYFDVNLANGGYEAHLQDVSVDHEFYHYVKALYASGKGSVLGEFFKPDMPINQYFLKYLVNEYQKNS